MEKQPEDQPIKGALSYSCTFDSHQFCDGEVTHTHPQEVRRCACPCHREDVVLKGGGQ